MKNKVAIYCRISTKTQNLYNQKLILAEYAHKNNYDFDIFEEIESTRNTRPVKQSLLNHIRSGAIYDSIIVYSFDRWARDYHELLCDIKELLKHNINFISVSDNIDITTKQGSESLKLIMAFYKFELEKISERTRLGLERVRNEGHVFLGRPKGAKDTVKRKTDGYFEREKNKRLLKQ